MAIERIKGEPSVNDVTCNVAEYGEIGTTSVAEAHIHGRYPENGFALNEQSDMMIRVISGAGVVAIRSAGYELHKGDVVRISSQTPYYYEGDKLHLLLISSPAWNSHQYKYLE